MIKVSMIIPCYNAMPYLDICMNSILEDELKEKEIIFINDGSKDDTLKKLQEFEKQYSNVVVMDKKNGGQASARNLGLKKAQGEFIYFLDVDDYIAKNAVKIMYEFAKKHDYDYVYSDYYEHHEDQDLQVSNHHSEDLKKDAVIANFAPWAKLISKKLIDDISFQFCEDHIFEDIAVIPHLGASSSSPGYLNKPLYYYNMANTSTMRKKEYDPRFEDYFYISDYIYEQFQKDHLIEPYYEELKYVYLDGILKSGVLLFAKYKEGTKHISKLRKNVKQKFSNLLDNKYYKKEPGYRKLTAMIAVYFPPILVRLAKKIKQ